MRRELHMNQYFVNIVIFYFYGFIALKIIKIKTKTKIKEKIKLMVPIIPWNRSIFKFFKQIFFFLNKLVIRHLHA